MERNWVISLLIFVVLFAGFSSVSATPPAKIVCGVASNVVSALVKWLWSLKSTPRTEFSSRSMMKFEGGYTVETVFDGSKLGIDPYSVAVSPSGELLVLDSENSNIYKISTPLSQYSQPKLIAGSPEGYSGHVDGKLREARMSHPKGITVDDRGNIYVADTLNMAIRKITDAGMVTIAAGKWGRGGGHVDGPSEDAKFSDDFDMVYIGSSCSLLVVDRGNHAIHEIQLQEDDCTYQYDGNLHLGIAMLVAAAFFGYMLALLQRRVGSMFSSHKDPETSMRKDVPPAPYQRPIKYVRPPLIPTEDESEKPEEGLFGRKKPRHNHIQQHYQQPIRDSNAWPMQESFVIPDENEPPSIETRTSAPRKTNPFTTKDAEKTHHFKQSRSFHASIETRTSAPRKTYPFTTEDAEKSHHFNQSHSLHSGWNDNLRHQQQQQQQQQLHQRHYSSGPQTYYEKRCETNEIVFGAVQEQDGRRGAVVIKAVDYGDPMYNNHNFRSRYNYMGYYYG